MFKVYYKPAEIIESKGAAYFIPPHPLPRERDPDFLQVILGARYSLIDNWIADYYRSGVFSFRILGRQVVLVNSPEHVKAVLVTRNANYERKSPQMRRALEALLGDGLFISDGETWKKRRPIVADIVHKRRMPEFAPVMEHAASALADAWAGLKPGTELELTSEMAQLTAHIIARAVFGHKLGIDAASRVVDGFSTYQESIDSFNIGYFLGAASGWPLLNTRARRRAINMVHSVVDAAVEVHLSGRGDAGSMIDLLIERNRRSPGLNLDTTALRNEAATIFMAGHETTATTLTWAFYLIANATWAEERLQREIDEVCGDRAPAWSDVAKLEYCRAIVQETLRLYPPVPILPRQALNADNIAGVDIEKNALVIVAPWLLHRARDLWENPNHFMPERFMGDERVNPFAFIPFSVGPRICAGMNFGLDEAVLCLAILAQKFRIILKSGYSVSPVCRLTLRPASPGVLVTVQPRRRMHS